MKPDALDEKDDSFWKKVSNVKTEQALIFMILKELRACDLLNESNSVKMTRLSKMVAYTELLDLDLIYKKAERLIDADDELINSMQEQ